MISDAGKNKTRGIFILAAMLAISLTGCLQENNTVELIQDGEYVLVVGGLDVVMPTCGLPTFKCQDSQNTFGGFFRRDNLPVFEK